MQPSEYDVQLFYLSAIYLEKKMAKIAYIRYTNDGTRIKPSNQTSMHRIDIHRTPIAMLTQLRNLFHCFPPLLWHELSLTQPSGSLI